MEALHKEQTKAGEFLWLLKVQGSVALTRPETHLPDLKIDFSSLTRYLDLTRLQQRATALSQQWQPPAAVATDLATHRPPPPTTNLNRAQPSQSATAPAVLPGVTLSITKQDGLLLLTFSPVVAGANLEQAALHTSPWAWQPAVTATNTAANGWNVVPTPEPRVFRIRLDQ